MSDSPTRPEQERLDEDGEPAVPPTNTSGQWTVSREAFRPGALLPEPPGSAPQSQDDDVPEDPQETDEPAEDVDEPAGEATEEPAGPADVEDVEEPAEPEDPEPEGPQEPEEDEAPGAPHGPEEPADSDETPQDGSAWDGEPQTAALTADAEPSGEPEDERPTEPTDEEPAGTEDSADEEEPTDVEGAPADLSPDGLPGDARNSEEPEASEEAPDDDSDSASDLPEADETDLAAERGAPDVGEPGHAAEPDIPEPARQWYADTAEPETAPAPESSANAEAPEPPADETATAPETAPQPYTDAPKAEASPVPQPPADTEAPEPPAVETTPSEPASTARTAPQWYADAPEAEASPATEPPADIEAPKPPADETTTATETAPQWYDDTPAAEAPPAPQPPADTETPEPPADETVPVAEAPAPSARQSTVTREDPLPRVAPEPPAEPPARQAPPEPPARRAPAERPPAREVPDERPEQVWSPPPGAAPTRPQRLPVRPTPEEDPLRTETAPEFRPYKTPRQAPPASRPTPPQAPERHALEPRTYPPDTREPRTREPQAYAPDTRSPETYEPQRHELETYEPQTREPQVYAPEAYRPGPYESEAYDYQASQAEAAAPEAPPWGGAETQDETVHRPSAEPKRSRKRRWPLVVAAVLAVLLAAAVTVQLVRPLPEPTMRLTLPASHTFPGTAPALPLPAGGQAVIGVEGVGTMGASGPQTPIPTASVAKVMTAYVFLKNHPLKSGEDGPTFTISPQEAARLNFRKARGESHVDVRAGQPFTERKALEALMVVSANNIAHELARWDSGNEQAFVAKMNATAQELGMTNTRYTDPSGYDSNTVSTAADQVKLLRAAMKLPAFAEVVANRTYVPNDGGPVRPAGNILLGHYGIVGGKTGYTDAAGGNFVFAARRQVSGVNTLMIGAVMGQRGTSAVAAMTVAQRLVATAQNTLTMATLARAGQPAAVIDDGLGRRTPVAAGRPITAIGWPGLTVRLGIDGTPPGRGAQGEEVGAVTVGDGSGQVRFPLRLAQSLAEPDLVTRLTRLN